MLRLQISEPSIFTVPLLGRKMPGNHAEHGRLAASGRPDHVENLAEVSLEAHVLHGVGLGLAFSEPFVETDGLDCGFSHDLAPEDIEWFDPQDLANPDIAGDGGDDDHHAERQHEI